MDEIKEKNIKTQEDFIMLLQQRINNQSDEIIKLNEQIKFLLGKLAKKESSVS